ncbi:hypothetical protein T05_13425 [Trichinella murrelli]|uniref:Uncharacterized protein n=1 Tax=Trichinella murrelli TaxID=144512 RepID=A0A0V0T8L2_9BILA|nr:hypothetical protein T05_13425 [Trichinella murrelli]
MTVIWVKASIIVKGEVKNVKHRGIRRNSTLTTSRVRERVFRSKEPAKFSTKIPEAMPWA